MLDAHQMNVFLTAATTLNFTAAARQLHMTQPSVSQHIQVLEQHFNTRLFVRSGRQLTLTAAGEALLPLARQMVGLSVHIDEAMVSLQGEVYGRLKLGCSSTAGKYALPSLLAAFLGQNPRVTVTCQALSPPQAIEALCQGQVHLALFCARDGARQIPLHPFFSDPVTLFVPADHPWAGRRAVDPQELLAGRFVLQEEGANTFPLIRQGLAQVSVAVENLNAVLTLPDSEGVALAVAEGAGAGFCSRLVARRVAGERVRAVQVRGLAMTQQVAIGQQARLPASAAQAAFWALATDPANALLRQLQEAN